MTTRVLLILGLFSGPVFAAATGRVVGPEGSPVSGAEVCVFAEGRPERCVKTDPNGHYRMDDPMRSTLLVRARGFVPKSVDASPQDAPVQLQAAARLLVNVVDAATRVAVPSGRVMIDSPSGRRIGDYVPFNAKGVRISTLDPGDVFVRVEAAGYSPSGPVPVQLVSGVERAVTVALKKIGG